MSKIFAKDGKKLNKIIKTFSCTIEVEQCNFYQKLYPIPIVMDFTHNHCHMSKYENFNQVSIKFP